MLILIPVLLLLLSSAAILILRLLQTKFAYPWLIAAISAFLSWISFCIFRFFLPTSINLTVWSIGNLENLPVGLLLDYSSWAYGLCVITLVLAVILTATARAQYQTDAYSWVGALAYGSLGLMSVLSANPTTLLLTWAAMDLINLGIQMSASGSANTTSRSLMAYAAQTLGILFVMGSLLAGHSSGSSLGYENIPEQGNLFLLVGIGLRLGVFPLHLPFSMEPRLRRGMGSLLRLIPIASALMLLGRLPAVHLPGSWNSILISLAALSALYSALMWINSEDEVEGRPYWIIASTALALACVLRGFPQASLAWGIGAILSGGLMFLFSARAQRLWFLWVFGVWGFSGLPYSPAASGWDGLLGMGTSVGLGLVFLVTQVLLLLGYVRYTRQFREPLDVMEPWVKTIYPIGLLFIPLAMVLIVIAGWHGSRVLGMVWPGLIGVILVAGGLLTQKLRPNFADAASQTRLVEWTNPFLNGIFQGINTFLGLDWLYRLLGLAYRAINRMVAILSGMLEGDGGVLWALLLLTLLITVLQSGKALP